MSQIELQEWEGGEGGGGRGGGRELPPQAEIHLGRAGVLGEGEDRTFFLVGTSFMSIA